MRISIALVLILAALASVAAAQEPAKAVLKSYDVTLIKLDAPVTRANESGMKIALDQVYLVRLRGEFPVNSAKPMELYLGDKKIGEFGSWPGGIYFILLDKASLDAFTGKDFGYRMGGKKTLPLGAKFEPAKFDLTKAIPEKEAIARL
jgi:hypothetical protein